MDSIKVNGVDITAAITDNCAILTVIEIPMDTPSLQTQVRYGRGIDVKEHDSVVDALQYIKGLDFIKTGDWDRVYIINPERLRKHG